MLFGGLPSSRRTDLKSSKPQFENSIHFDDQFVFVFLPAQGQILAKSFSKHLLLVVVETDLGWSHKLAFMSR